MRLIRWSFQNIHIPMIENEGGDLFCTTKILSSALNQNPRDLRKIYHRHRDEFDPVTLRGVENLPKEFLEKNRVELGIRRMKEDLYFWSESDMLLMAVLSRSSVSKEFRKNLIQFIKTQARRDFVTREAHNELEARLNNLEDVVKIALEGAQRKLHIVK